MNDEPDPAPETQPPKPAEPQPPQQHTAAATAHSRPFSHWLKHLFACNPFYPASVLLLLYGCYRISIEPRVFNNESAHLLFNFSSLQIYEFLLVGTAIALARRRIWYDSTLLAGFENLLLLVPLILMSQAGLIESRLLWVLCAIAGVLAIVRLTSVKVFIPKINFPRPLLWIGWLVLLTNIALLVTYRILHQSKFGTRLEAGAAYYTNEFAWLLAFPLLCSLGALLPPSLSRGELWPERRWLPLCFFGLWIIGTGVHLYCLGYVYDFNLRAELLAPALWVLLWLFRQRLCDLITVHPTWERALLVPPALITLVAWTHTGSKVFLALTLLNAALYAAIYFAQRDERLAFHLLVLSLAALFSGVPESWHTSLPDFTRSAALGCSLASYIFFWVISSRNPQLGVTGALVLAVVVLAAAGDRSTAPHWALQSGFVFLLLHSLRWLDFEHTGAKAVRFLAATGWVVHAFFWTRDGASPVITITAGTFVIVAYLALKLWRRKWGSLVVPIAAVLVMLSGPANFAGARLRYLPVGLTAVAASFMLFGLGTTAALTRHRWHSK